MCTRQVAVQFTVSLKLYESINAEPPYDTIVSEPTITKDNPAFSMINDSDEDVIYDDESRKPLNSSGGKGNDYDSD